MSLPIPSHKIQCTCGTLHMTHTQAETGDLLDVERKQERYRNEHDTARKQLEILQKQLVQKKAEVERGCHLIACYEKKIQELEAVVADTDRKHEAQMEAIRKVLTENILAEKKTEYQPRVQSFSETDHSSSVEEMETTNQADQKVPSQQQTQCVSQNLFQRGSAAPQSVATSQPSAIFNFSPVRMTAAEMTQGSTSVSFESFPLAFGQSVNSGIPTSQVLGGADGQAPPQVLTWKEQSPSGRLLSTNTQDSDSKISPSSSYTSTGFDFSTAGMNLNFTMTGTNVVPVFNSGGSAESRIVRKARRRESTGTNVVSVFNSGGSAESHIVRKARRRKS